jgi:hypothetical protein
MHGSTAIQGTDRACPGGPTRTSRSGSAGGELTVSGRPAMLSATTAVTARRPATVALNAGDLNTGWRR